MSFEIAKAGWLQRQSSILRRWKKNWVVLYQDGSLKYFESPDSHTAEDAERMTSCQQILTGTSVNVDNTPEGLGRTCLFSVRFKDSTWTFCAESPDDMRAWQVSLEQFKAIAHRPPNMNVAYPTQQVAYAYPGQQWYGSHPPQYVVQQGQPGQVTYVYADAPRYYRRGYDGTDVAMGAVAGAAIGSMMWGPLLWW
ncbi:hypothetical protein CAPTEDRAFT_223114 [Capitella teleta]|uniref:PH domain-containing protein n=1 Tax=Capitella teleta TaxID=283909 RepID=R7T4Q8_CAPTE|nr:hypothetical protein CAPTEDRAFT_223114 [Capitella teleta]|eukprot:ELT88062.1 hypothetical protein CAPTEDRAFT_223114 [Capitella teleta]